MARVTTPFWIQMDDGREFESKFLPIDTMMAEKHIGKLSEEPMSATFYAVYNALKRGGQITDPMTFTEFVEAMADLDVDPEAEESGNGQAPGGASPSESSPTRPGSLPAS